MNAPPIASEESRADIFISHASEDKSIARPLAEALRRRGLTVWYDEYVLRLGDSLRGVIDRGLASARFGVVILSPRFFAKEWPQRELNGFLARETVNRTKVLLPVWHELTYEEVAKHSPILADRLAVSTDRGIEYVVEQILDVLEAEGPRVARVTPTASPGPSTQVQATKDPAATPPVIAKAPTAKKPAAKTSVVSKASAAKVPTVKTSPAKASGKRLAPFPLAIAIGALMVVGITAGVVLKNWLNQATLGPTDTAQDENPTETPAGAPDKGALTELRSEVEALEALVTPQRLGAPILTDVWQAIPELLWLDKLSYEKSILAVEGRAFNTNAIAALMENLDRIPDLEEPSLVDTSEEPGGIYRFNVRMERAPQKLSDSRAESSAGLQRRRNELLRSLPSPSATSAVMSLVKSVAEESDLIPEVSSDQSEGAGLVEVVPMKIRVEGAFENLVSLLSRLNGLSFPAAVTGLSLQTSGGQSGTVLCTFYLRVPFSEQGLGMEVSKGDWAGLPANLKPLRNPFKSLVAAPARRVLSLTRPEGIPGLLIDEFELIGIFRTSKGFVAQVMVEGKNKSYLLREGDQLYDGDVVSISRNEVVFKQIVQDPTAPKPFREVVKSLLPNSSQ